MECGSVDTAQWISRVNADNVQKDLDRCLLSSHCVTYAGVVPDRPYLVQTRSFNEQRLAMQVLLNNVRFPSLFWKGTCRRFFPSSACPHCLAGHDTLDHLLTRCSAFTMARLQYLRTLPVDAAATPSLPVVLKSQNGLVSVAHFIRCIWPIISEF